VFIIIDAGWVLQAMSAVTFSQKFVKDTDEMPQASNQNCNTMASNICWPKIVRTKLDKAYLNQKAAESIDDIHLQ